MDSLFAVNRSLRSFNFGLRDCRRAGGYRGQRSFAGSCTNGKVAPIADLPALTPEREGSTDFPRPRSKSDIWYPAVAAGLHPMRRFSVGLVSKLTIVGKDRT